MFRVCVVLSVLITCTVGYKVQPISQKTWIEGYGPCWDKHTKRFYFVDCFNSTITSYDAEKKHIFTAILPGIYFPTIVMPITDRRNHFLVSCVKIAVIIKWNGKDPVVEIVEQIFRVESEPKYIYNGIHMAGASYKSKFIICGTFRGPQCSDSQAPNGGIYSFSKKTGVIKQKIPASMKTVGGIVLNARGDKAFAVDLCNDFIREYCFDPRTGQISNGKIVYKYHKQFGGPLSCLLAIAIDTHGYLYVSIWLGGVILKIDPRTGEIVLVIKMPVKLVAGIAWGGEDHDILLVTTSIPFFNIKTGLTSNSHPSNTANSGKVYTITGLCGTGVVANNPRI